MAGVRGERRGVGQRERCGVGGGGHNGHSTHTHCSCKTHRVVSSTNAIAQFIQVIVTVFATFQKVTYRLFELTCV